MLDMREPYMVQYKGGPTTSTITVTVTYTTADSWPAMYYIVLAVIAVLILGGFVYWAFGSDD